MSLLMCARCCKEADKLFDAPCLEKPELLKGQPIGMYHCPDCGAMLVAGIPHGTICKECKDEIESYMCCTKKTEGCEECPEFASGECREGNDTQDQ